MQKETTWKDDSVTTNSNMISEKDNVSEGNPQKNNNNQRTHSSSSGKLEDILITQFLKPVDNNENDIQVERLRKMHELEPRRKKRLYFRRSLLNCRRQLTTNLRSQIGQNWKQMDDKVKPLVKLG